MRHAEFLQRFCRAHTNFHAPEQTARAHDPRMPNHAYTRLQRDEKGRIPPPNVSNSQHAPESGLAPAMQAKGNASAPMTDSSRHAPPERALVRQKRCPICA